MEGGDTTEEEMISTTKRGLLVTRFGSVKATDGGSLMLTGVTRDGLWLIENGKITHSVKNFRFNDSPLFVFNGIEQMGKPVRVFSPRSPAVVPPIKVHEFNFSSLADAV
jgi:predicted Zn-dependent protease